MIFCVVGFSSFKKTEILKILNSNVGSVLVCFDILKENLLNSNEPKFIIFSSR